MLTLNTGRSVIVSVLLAFCLSHFVVSSSAQEAVYPMSIGLGGGVDLISNKDLAASPLKYNGFGLPISVNAFSNNQNLIHDVQLSLIIPVFTNNYAIRSDQNSQLISWTKINLKYSLLKNIDNQVFVGGTIKSDIFYREYDFLDGMSWDIVNSLNITVARNVAINNQSFILPRLSVPVLGYLHRKPGLTFDEKFLDDFYNEGPADLIKYGSWNLIIDNWFAFEFNLLYQYRINEKLLLQARSGFNFYTIQRPEKVTHFNVPILCHLNYQL